MFNGLGRHDIQRFVKVEFDQFLGNYHEDLRQILNTETDDEAHDLGYLESCAAAMRQSFVPTETEFREPGETPNEDSATNWQSDWESEEVDVGLSMRVHELRLESRTPSTSKSAAGRRKQKPKPKKKEESGVCGHCNQEFSRKSDARRHEITVHGTGVYVCELCDAPCNRKDALKRHIRLQHDDQH